MIVVILAGGAGTRLWPLSRKNSPKQFQPILEGKSTLQLAVDRIQPLGASEVFVATNEAYLDIVRRQVPQIPEDHIMTEPCKRDLAAAVGLALVRLRARGLSGPVAILWSDHLMQHPDAFVEALQRAENLVKTRPEQLVFLAEEPRFANQNLGWIRVGEERAPGEHAFLGWKYKPTQAECEQLFASGEWRWNPGYFVFDLDRMLSLYAEHQPDMFAALTTMSSDETLIATEYPKLESVHFDKAIIEQIDPSEAVVLPVNLGWSDPGTLYALKEAFVPNKQENYVQGSVVSVRTHDSFLYNEEAEKVVCTLGVNGLMVVNTKDALFVCPKDEVPQMKEILEKLEEEGKEGLL